MLAVAALILLQVQGPGQSALEALPPQQRTLFEASRERTARTVVFKLQDDMPSFVQGGLLQGVSPALQSELAPWTPARYLDFPDEQLLDLRSRAMAAGAWPVPADLTQYFEVLTASPEEAAALVSALKQQPEIQHAYIPGLPAPPPVDRPPVTPIWTSQQTFLLSAPDGINAEAVAGVLGSQGLRIQVTDCEYSWVFDHEDLELHMTDYVGGLQEGFPGGLFIDHGTAVAGVVYALDNEYGMLGATPNVVMKLSTQWRDNGVNNPTRSIMQAALASGAGDIILVEIQTTGPNSELLPEEWNQASFDIIQQATALGMVVIAAAGNGAVDLDDPAYAGAFDRTVRDSGAIFVGAGSSASPHVRKSFSNFGSIVDAYSWGENVYTLGYGDLFFPADPLQAYTQSFSGTSSASAIVAGAVASVLGVMESHAMALPAIQDLRDALRNTGTPQDPADAALTPIGNQPDTAALHSWFQVPAGMMHPPRGAIGSLFTIDLAGQPNEDWVLYRALNTVRTVTPEGVIVLGNQKQKTVATGTLDGSGLDSITANIPNKVSLIGRVVYTQAKFIGPFFVERWSNGGSVRFTP